MYSVKFFTIPLILIICLSINYLYGQELYQQGENKKTKWVSFENPKGEKGAGGKENKGAKGHPADIIAPFSKMEILNDQGAGIIKRIWLTVNERSPVMLRSIYIEMYWDGSSKPAVSAPLGDFFGIGLGKRIPFESEFFSDPEGRSFNCYIPMPYRKSARVVIGNDSDKPVTLFYDINIVKTDPGSKAMYFHSYWNRSSENPLGVDYEILPNTAGTGRFLGCNIGIITDSTYENTWWGEGEVKMYLDGDKQFPTIIGTGTEDYIGTAWGQGAFNHRFQGCPIADEKNRQWAFYRYHVPDPVYFDNQIRVTIQEMGGGGLDHVRSIIRKGANLKPVTVSGDKFYRLLDMETIPDIFNETFPEGWVNFYRQDDYSSTAYFYLNKPENELPALFPVDVRTRKLENK